MNHKKITFSIVFFLILAIGLSIGFSSPTIINSNGNFATPKASVGEITIITPENKTYTEPDSGYYPATYGFENNEIGAPPSDWQIDPMDGSSYIEVDQHLDGHNYVVEQRKNGGTMRANMVKRFGSNASVGSVEFWFYKDTDSGTDATRLYILGDAGTGDGRFEYGFTNGDLHYGFWDTRTVVATDILTKNLWHYIQVEFDTSQGVQIRVDSVLYGAGYAYPFLDNPTIINGFKMCSLFSGGNPNYGAWIDAIGFSWDPYYGIGDNLNEGLLLSYDNTTNLDWKGYSLDGQTNKTILGNTTIPFPSDGAHNIQVFGNDTIGTIYESNMRYFTVDTTPHIDIISPENRTYTEPDSGYYPATYGFENDIDGQIPENWYGMLEANRNTSVVKLLNEHNKVLKFYDNTASSHVSSDNVFSWQTYGTVEYWWSVTDTSQSFAIVLGVYSPNTWGVAFSIYDDYFQYSDSSSSHIIVGAPIPQINQWYHIKIEFRCEGSPAYAGLNENRYFVYINGVKYGEFPFFTNLNSFNRLTYSTGTSAITTAYVDAVGYSWDPNYNIGDNLNEGLLVSYESNIDLDWQGYSLDGQANKTILGNTTIPIPLDGQHHVQVFGNDTMGTMYSSEVRYFDVDVNPVDITIISPSPNDLFQTVPPEFEIFIDDPDLNATWYSLDGITTIPFTGFTGAIDLTEWNKMLNGTVTIGFYANDSANHISYESVKVRKDILGPIITVNSPQMNEVEGVSAPYYDLSILEYNLDAMWCSFDYGVTTFPLISLIGTLDQTEWEKKGGGTVPIRFYANDSLGHESFIDVLVVKDLISPIISINSPSSGDIFGATSPNYDISITESNLDSYWYTLDGGIVNVSISSLTGTISQTEWNKKGNGTVTIRFYARDEGGNQALKEVFVRKDINVPLIDILSPSMLEVSGHTPPEFELSVVEPNLDSMWYTLDDGATTYPIIGLSGTIDSAEWSKFGEGMVVIKFYAEDSVGNQAFAEVQVEKDLTAPVITIDQPDLGDVFINYPPIYSISIIDLHSYTFWYTLDNGAHNNTITELTGAISDDAWDSIPNGHITLRFYAKDEAGNIGQASVLIIKDAETPTNPPPGIPGYNILFILSIIGVITAILIRKRLKS